MRLQGRPDRQGVAGRSIERVRQFDPGTTSSVDKRVLEGSLPLQQGRWQIGREEGRVREGVLQRPAQSKGRILDRRLQGSAAPEVTRFPRPHRVSGKAQPDYCYLG
jgi:hypothetical protein